MKAEEEVISVSAPIVYPYTRWPVCKKCGHGNGLIRYWWAFSGNFSFGFVYCPGSLDSKLTRDMGVFRVEEPTRCFGIFHEHLHVECGRCKSQWLMETKQAK